MKPPKRQTRSPIRRFASARSTSPGRAVGGQRLDRVRAGVGHVLEEQRRAPAVVEADQVAAVVRGLHALHLVGLDELAEVVGRDADPDPGLVHRDRVDAGLAELLVEALEPVGADAHQVVHELGPVVDVRREVDEAADLGGHVPRADDVVQPPRLVADLLDHAGHDRHVVEIARGEMAQRRQLLLGLVALEQEVVARGAEAVLGAVRVVEVAVGRADHVRVLAPAVAAPGLLERLHPGVRLEGAREEHARPDLVLADVLAVRRDHRVEPEVLLHLHDRAHRVVDPVLEQVEERLVGGLSFLISGSPSQQWIGTRSGVPRWNAMRVRSAVFTFATLL